MTGVRALSSLLLLLYLKLTSVHCNDVGNGDIDIDLTAGAHVYINDMPIPICWEKSTRDGVANTLCKQLGFDGADYTEAISKKIGIPITMDGNVLYVSSCEGDASHIFQCVYNICKLESCCESKKILAVTCSSAEYVYEGQLSLEGTSVRSKSTSEGKLRVYLNGKWTSVCNETFGDDEAKCSCKQLGYTGGQIYDPNIDHDPIGEQDNMMWIGADSHDGSLNCSSSESCLTKCYSKPEQTTQCMSNKEVYLKCDYDMTMDKNQAGSRTLCEFSKKKTAGISKSGIAGIVSGSILFAIICLIGTCCGFYFCAKAKKPCVKDEPSEIRESSMKLNYAVVENYDSTCADSEQEDRFDYNHYQPPTPLLQNDETR